MEAEVRKADGTVISAKRDVTIVDTANPFGNLAEIDIEDDSGNLYDDFEFGTRIEIYVRDLLTDFELEADANDLTISETETITIGESTQIASTETVSVGETQTEEYNAVYNQGTLENAGTVRSGTEIRTQRVWENSGTVTNYTVAQSTGDKSRPPFSQRFTGYVVERNDQNENSGRDNLQLTVYSFDQLLRADSVSNDQTGKDIIEALEDIIKTDTAVTWDANNVSVGDEQQLTESLQGEKVEDALLKLSKKSVDEDFGVNDDIEFFFREQEPVSAPSDITDADWIDYQLPERGEENKNESRTYFNADSTGDSDRVAVVDDGVNQLELQESLGTDDPVVIADDRDRNDLSDVDDAAEDSEQNLDDKEVARVYEFVAEAEDFLEAQPGQVFDVTIEAAGIDGEFRIAELEYADVGSTVRITAIRNKGNTDDVLRRVTERLRRKELETADFDGPEDRINQAEVGVLIENTATVDGTNWDSTRVTNTLRNQIRDGWAGRGNINVAEIRLGTDPSGLARTNESLENQVATASVSETLDGSFGIDYSASFSQTGIQEIGLFDGSGNLLYRAVNDAEASPGTVSVNLTINNNSDIPKAVVTDLGRESIRDIIADNSPALPVNYGFGSDQTEPSTADTTLGTSVFVSDLENILIDDRSTQAEWEDYVTTNIPDDSPLHIANGLVQNYQSVFSDRQVANNDGFVGSGTVTTEIDVANATNNRVQYVPTGEPTGTGWYYDFNLDYTIPNSEIIVYIRLFTEDALNPQQYEITLNGSTIESLAFASSSDMEWQTIIPADQGFADDLTAGDHRLEITLSNDDSGTTKFDRAFIGDQRAGIETNPDNLDNTVDANDALSEPEAYYDLTEVDFAEVSTRRDIDKASVDSTWRDNNVSNQQFIELSNDGGSTWKRVNNSATPSVDFDSLERGVQERAGISRYGSGSETPTNGDTSQAIDVWELFANPSGVVPDGIGTALTIGIIPRGEVTGSTIAELGQLDESENTLTRSIRGELTVESEMRVFGRERLQIRQA